MRAAKNAKLKNKLQTAKNKNNHKKNNKTENKNKNKPTTKATTNIQKNKTKLYLLDYKPAGYKHCFIITKAITHTISKIILIHYA